MVAHAWRHEGPVTGAALACGAGELWGRVRRILGWKNLPRALAERCGDVVGMMLKILPGASDSFQWPLTKSMVGPATHCLRWAMLRVLDKSDGAWWSEWCMLRC
jgi:hypothetical protein